MRDGRVLPGSPLDVSKDDGYIRESAIEAMTPDEFEQHEGWLDQAGKDGRIIRGE
jgi:hypothetical protein